MLENLISLLLHIDVYLNMIVSEYGFATYVILFLVIFCETGLVVTPFLPGDSLLFATGALAASNDDFSIRILLVSLIIAAVLGNKVNYFIGRFVGPKIFHSQQSWLLNKKHLAEAHAFYKKHGGKTIILARFIPIIRTFVPFVAGIGCMPLKTFTVFNALSGIFWVSSLLYAGYFLGTIPWVSNNLNIVIYIIVAVSLLPPILTFIFQKIKSIFMKPADKKQ